MAVDIERTIQASIEKQEWDLIKRLDSHYTRLREALIESYKEVDEFHYTQGTTCPVAPQSQNEFICTDILAYCGPNPGQITIGQRQIIIPAAQLTTFSGRFRIKNTDPRKLDSVTLTGGAVTGVGAAGTLFLELMGYEIPIGSLAW